MFNWLIKKIRGRLIDNKNIKLFVAAHTNTQQTDLETKGTHFWVKHIHNTQQLILTLLVWLLASEKAGIIVSFSFRRLFFISINTQK